MSSAAAHAFNSIGIGLGIVGLVTAALLFAVQSRSYRRTHHPSLELLQLASAAAFGYGGLSFVARWLWRVVSTPTMASFRRKPEPSAFARSRRVLRCSIVVPAQAGTQRLCSSLWP